jgi:hypothetical protein
MLKCWLSYSAVTLLAASSLFAETPARVQTFSLRDTAAVESCRRLKLPVRDYLAAVLPGLADLPIQRLPELTPTAWVAQRSWT